MGTTPNARQVDDTIVVTGSAPSAGQIPVATGTGNEIEWAADDAGGQVNSVVGSDNITVDSSDPVNPIVTLDAAQSFENFTLATTDQTGVEQGFSTPHGSVIVWDADGTNTSVSLQHNGTDVLTVDENGVTSTDQFLSASGTSGAPTYSFSIDPDTGIFRAGSNAIGLSAGGSTVGVINSSGVISNFAMSALATSGHVFNGDTDTGIFGGGANSMFLRAAGNTIIEVDNNSIDDRIGFFTTTPVAQPALTSGTVEELITALGSTSGLGLVDDSGAAPFGPNYGQRAITQNSTSIAFTAAVDSTLATNSDYIQITGIFNATPDGENEGVTQQTNSVTIAIAGVYNIEVWLSATSSINSTALAVKFGVNGVIGLGRRPKLFIRNSGEVHSLSAFGYHHFDAGDVITLYAASDKTANITFEDAVFGVQSIRYD